MIGNRNYQDLLWYLAVTDFKLRYYGSYLGYLWTLLKPLSLFSVLYVVFSFFMQWEIPFYQLYLLLGILLWSFFSECTMMGMLSLANRVGIIKKIYFPRIIVVFSSTLSALLGLIINLIVFAIFSLIAGKIPAFPYIILFLLYILMLYLIGVGFSLLLAALYIKFRDINQVWEVLLQIGFWLTPIIYPMKFVPEKYQFYLQVNPLTGIIQFSRMALIESQLPTLGPMLYVFGVSALIFIVGYVAFVKVQHLAPEVL